MGIFDIDEQVVKHLIKLLTGWDCPDVTALWVTRVLLWLVVLCIILGAFYKWVYLPNKEKRIYIRSHVDSGYREYLSRNSSKYYINTCFQNIPPSYYPDLMDSLRSVSSEDMINKYLKDIFVESNSDSPLYCVLGGSGMGKTSFLINVLKAYVNKYTVKNRPFDIVMISLAGENFRDKLLAVQNPQNTILLLDAIDENPQAVSNYDEFIRSLEDDIELFHIVVITCRTQFFPDEEHEPQESKLKCHGRRKGFYGYTRHYISPFSDEAVEKYLKKKYRLKPKKRKIARKIVHQCPSFAHRPLLLSFMEMLIDVRRDYNTVLDIYETLIDKWLEREASISENSSCVKDNMMQLLQAAAIKMYNNFQTSGYCLDTEEIKILLVDRDLSHLHQQFRGRSLLNRDAIGFWKFSHKSFLEYFLAKEYFENDHFSLDFLNLDVAHTIYKDLCMRELQAHINIGEVSVHKSHELLSVEDTVKIESNSTFNIRYLEPFDKIKILEIDAKQLPEIEPFIDRTNVYYLRITNYLSRISINGILRCPQIRYILINGDNCSKTFIKESAKLNVAVLNNSNLYNFSGHREHDEVPIDFYSALYANSLFPLPVFRKIFQFN